MRNRVVGILVMGVVAGLVGLLLRTPHEVAGAEGALKIGIIDLNRALAECQMGKDRVEKLRAASGKKREDLEKKLEDVKKLDEELKLLDAASEAAGHKRRVVTEKRALLRAEAALAQTEMRQTFASAHKAIYAEIFKVLEEFRKANGFDMLLRKDALDVEGGDPMVLKALLRTNTVLCVAPELDVTDQIIKILDERCARQKK